MKGYKLFTLFCKCSWRMRSRGKICHIYTTPTIRRCPNCKKEYIVHSKYDNLEELTQRKNK